MRAAIFEFPTRSQIRRLAALCCLLLAPLASAIDAGAPAPDFTVAGAEGKPLQLSAYRGKLVLSLIHI